MTAWRRAPAPPGYIREWHSGDRELVASRQAIGAARAALADGTLFEYAAHHPEQRVLEGRGVAYSTPLPGVEVRVVVRHARHGGLLASARGDRFIGPTRAPRELRVSLRLRALGVPTPELLVYATYPAGAFSRSADVATREIQNGCDLGVFLSRTQPGEEREAAWRATARLLAKMESAGVRHPDLNIANILLAPDENGALEAWLLDVDRVWFDEPGNQRVTEANLRRLHRSARKQRDRRGLSITDEELATLDALIGQERS